MSKLDEALASAPVKFLLALKWSLLAFVLTLALGLLSMGVLGGLLYYPVSPLLGAYGDLESWHGDWVWPTLIIVGMGWSFAFLIAGLLDHLLKSKKAHGALRAVAYLGVLWLVDAALWLGMLHGQLF